MVIIHKHRFHRKDAKNAEKFFDKYNQKLCALCGFAVSLLHYGQTLYLVNPGALGANRLPASTIFTSLR
jgi:hypothetical protein